MPEKRTIHVPGDKLREVWLHRTWTGSGRRLYGVTYTEPQEPRIWHNTQAAALDAFADQIREEIELQKLDDYNDKREAETNA